jgi:hypothetical protein
MKRMGVLPGISAQATIDFEARVQLRGDESEVADLISQGGAARRRRRQVRDQSLTGIDGQ